MYLVKRNQPSSSFESYYNNLLNDFFGNEAFENADWSPRMEVEESNDKFLLHAELPGMKKEDIDISVKENVLTISGEKKARVRKEEASYHLNEINYGKFARTFKLPANVDVDNIKGQWAEGVLSVEIPKTEIAKPRKIEIN